MKIIKTALVILKKAEIYYARLLNGKLLHFLFSSCNLMKLRN